MQLNLGGGKGLEDEILSSKSGPQPDWDPDIVAALERAELTSDPEEQLEDDFVLMVQVIFLIWEVFQVLFGEGSMCKHRLLGEGGLACLWRGQFLVALRFDTWKMLMVIVHSF